MSKPRSVTASIALGAALALAGCVAPVGPVEVNRFHVPDIAALGHGPIRVEPASEQADDMEFRAYALAVTRELARIGYSEASGGQVAVLALTRQLIKPERGSSPVSVGVGGNAGSYGSGVGVGIGIDLSGPPPEYVETRLSVVIRDGARPLWEGRAAFTVRADSPMAQTSLGSAKMAEALFKGFPGVSGETILVK